ncbi:hypothetical protein [Metabacillus malikii]|uniref:Uncharacterized protein n=1 Tax=Metabacillus malikii TaxID=1504265 RepID=A0ABT9ZFQ5_9BACI|nr:hypothetical protein [Metabacillus malikii]MDQ0230090.1 hypothetical protein [Metabacillus malikii]
MSSVDQYELGKKVYQDWRMKVDDHNSYEIVRELGDEHLNVEKLKQGFIDERCACLKKQADFDDIECFYGALQEISTGLINK